SLGLMETPPLRDMLLPARDQKMTARREANGALEVTAADGQAALVDEGAEHDAPRILEMRGAPLRRLQHFRARQVVAGVVARPAIAARQPGAMHRPGHCR